MFVDYFVTYEYKKRSINIMLNYISVVIYYVIIIKYILYLF